MCNGLNQPLNSVKLRKDSCSVSFLPLSAALPFPDTETQKYKACVSELCWKSHIICKCYHRTNHKSDSLGKGDTKCFPVETLTL